jgi:hypothetical protein
MIPEATTTESTQNEAAASTNTASNSISVVDQRITELTKRLEASEQARKQAADELERRDVQQNMSNARDAFMKSIPVGVPKAYADIMFEHAKRNGLTIKRDGWSWNGNSDPVAGAAEFWKTVPSTEPTPAPSSTPAVGIPLQSGPRLTLSSLFGGT